MNHARRRPEVSVEFFVVCLAALTASFLSLFSGFGLGTILLPVFTLFFPPGVAVAQTALVHFLNNLFKLVMFGAAADRGVVLRFGLPAILAAFLGAWTLLWLAGLSPLATYDLGGRTYAVEPLKLVIALVMAAFSALELTPYKKSLTFGRHSLALGGLLSGYFGGLSGHQGAFRSSFLVRAGLSKEQFIGTGVVIACLVDFSRLTIYAGHLSAIGPDLGPGWTATVAATLAAFLGAFIGGRVLGKMTIRSLQAVVSGMLLLIAAGLGAGLL